MLLNDFFKITEIRNADKYLVSIELNPKHKIYEGHFPGNPIVPGVCLTQMVKETIEEITGRKLMMVTGDNIKFVSILNPEINPSITLSLSLKIKDNSLLYADSSVFSGEVNFFSFKGSFKDE